MNIATMPAKMNNTHKLAKLTILLLLCALLAAFSDIASAQVTVSTGTSGTPGADAWAAVKSVWFGPMGLVFGALVFAIAVYYFFKEGVLATFGVLAVGTFFFFIPALAISVQSWAKSF